MDSFSHFRVHFAAVLAIFACVLAVFSGRGSQRWMLLGVGLLSAGWITFVVSGPPPREAAGGNFRIVQFNLNFQNTHLDRVRDALSALDADAFTLQEVTPAHEQALRAVEAYPHQTHCFFRDYVGGVSILSKHPLSNVDCATGEGLVTAVINAPDGPSTVASIHTYWPWPLSQHAQVDRWLPRLAKIYGPLIVSGDFNAAPWSHAVAKVAQASGTKVVPGLRMTIGVKLWSWVPAIPIPIDHVLASHEFCVIAAAVGPELGSDHFPVIVDLLRIDPSASNRCQL